MRKIMLVCTGAVVAFSLVLPAAIQSKADPGNGGVTIVCDVWSQGFGAKDQDEWAGTVQGVGADEDEARLDAERKKWGPYGPMPYLLSCHPV